jgi:hypothetical protein
MITEKFSTVIHSKDHNIDVTGVHNHKDKWQDEHAMEIELKIAWTMKMDLKTRGVIGVDTTVQNVKVEISNQDEEEAEDITIEIQHDVDGWKIQSFIEFSDDGTLVPQEAEIDFEMKLITIS